eukprot:c18706_g1_i1 orf=798-1973(+)
MPPPWISWRNSLGCKSEPDQVHNPQKVGDGKDQIGLDITRRLLKSGCTRTLANLKDVVHSSRRAGERPSSGSPKPVEGSDFKRIASQGSVSKDAGYEVAIDEFKTHIASSRERSRGNTGDLPLKRFGSCYDCSVAPNPAASIVVLKGASGAGSVPLIPPVCQRCGEIFARHDTLEHHHLAKHAVTELSNGDSARNIMEIIFRTSWHNSEMESLKIIRVLKIHNVQKTIARFEDYRGVVKLKASKLAKKHARCIADGNELLRFFGTTLICSLGLDGSSALCTLSNCNVCRIIRRGFSSRNESGKGIYTTATSRGAHYSVSALEDNEGAKRAMVVCRVIAGRVHTAHDIQETVFPPAGFDSIAGGNEAHSNTEELYVFNPKAILPCFVVIYKC